MVYMVGSVSHDRIVRRLFIRLFARICLQDNKADVIDKYMPDEVRALKTAGELPDSVKLNETEEGAEDNFEFGSGGEEVRAPVPFHLFHIPFSLSFLHLSSAFARSVCF